MKNYKTISDMNIKDKTILLRIGADVPVDKNGNILDDSRLRLSVPTIKDILIRDPKKIVIITHIGRPKKNESYLTTDKLAEKLKIILTEENIFEKVEKLNDWNITKSSNAKIIVMENLRFNPNEKSKDEKLRNAFAKTLSNGCDIFVQDAFSNTHRDHASMTGIPKYLPSCVGNVVQTELQIIGNAIKTPKHPFTSIIGGLKADKLNTIQNLLKTTDKILIGGALAFIILRAKGYNTGKSKIDDEGLEHLNELLKTIKESNKIILPIDCAVATEFSSDQKRNIKDIDSIKDNEMALDIGPKTIQLYKDILSESKTIIWNGPIGVFEFPNFKVGTEEIAKCISSLNATTIVGGGDSANAIHTLGLTDKITHVSSGGGASLKLFEGKELIAIKVLKS